MGVSGREGQLALYARQQATAVPNAWGADVHYVSHTNASSNGKAQGCHPMYYTYSKNGKKLGEIMVKYRKQIYPRTVKLVPRADLYELKNTNAVAFYEEHAFHDNPEDATWFHTHMKEIAERRFVPAQEGFYRAV